jgi:queuine tRNA-ribosyltransferase
MHYKILTADGAARRGVIQTRRGIINTPSFMPVGTHGTVKAMSPDDSRTTLVSFPIAASSFM